MYPSFVNAFGTITKALYLQQMLYWSDRGERLDGYFYKTKAELKEETTLARTKQDTSREYFEALGILETKKITVSKNSKILHYKLNIPTLLEALKTTHVKEHRTCSTRSTKPALLTKAENTTETTASKEASPPPSACFPFKAVRFKAYILHWNSLPNIKKVMINRPSYVVQRLEKYFRQLEKGEFLNPKNKKLNTEWFKEKRIPLVKRKFMRDDIRRAMSQTAMYHKEGYWGNKLPKDLPTLMYNKNKQNSWFMKAFLCPPKPLAIDPNRPITDNNREVSVYIEEQVNGGYNGDKYSDRCKLVACSKSFKLFCDKIPAESMEVYKIFHEMGDPLRLCKEYIWWIEHHDWVEDITLGIMNTDNKLFERFVRDKQHDYQDYKLQ